MTQAAAVSPVNIPGEQFIPDVYAIRSNGKPMPGQLVSVSGHLAVVRAPSGRDYSFPFDAVLPAAEPEAHIRRDKVAAVLAEYSIKLVAFGTLRRTGEAVKVYHVSHPTEGRRSYTVAIGGVSGCTCSAFTKRRDCKHLDAVLAHQEPEITPAVTVGEIAAEDW